MTASSGYTIDTSWRLILKDLGIDTTNVLRRAALPGDLLARERTTLSTEAYFRLWRALDEEANDPTLPIRIGRVLSAEAFDPPIFAALCSPNLTTALRRIATYKTLICPMRLDVEVTDTHTALSLHWLDPHAIPPAALVATELVFFVRLARLATREQVRPLRVLAPVNVVAPDAFREYFGRVIEHGDPPTVVFSAVDASRPFLTANEAMWNFFEPALQKRLSQLTRDASTADRVRAALLELLPTGDATMNAVARRLGTSKRTLQRHLERESTTFQSALDTTRERLAKHYLGRSHMSGAEISFLLGYEDPNSFFRAFRAWTGETPEQARAQLAAR